MVIVRYGFEFFGVIAMNGFRSRFRVFEEEVRFISKLFEYSEGVIVIVRVACFC